MRSWLQTQLDESELGPEGGATAFAGRTAHCYGPVRVLLVDDNPVNLMLMSALLESRGLVPTLAADGAEAVALACELPFDLVLMDLQMPILDGLGATAAIRRFEADQSRAATPVLAYSSTCPGEKVLSRHGLNGSLSKPCDDQELEDCLVQWCPRYRPSPVNGMAHWQAASGASGSSNASLR
ncbi:MAG: response regulator [Rubrivivax sp.]|nr:response regulator [Rubrivivax sp.]